MWFGYAEVKKLLKAIEKNSSLACLTFLYFLSKKFIRKSPTSIVFGSEERCESELFGVLGQRQAGDGWTGGVGLMWLCWASVCAPCPDLLLMNCWQRCGQHKAQLFMYVYVLKAAALQGDTLGSIGVKLLLFSFSAACACCWDWDPSRLVSASCTIFCDVSSLFILRHNFPLCGAHLLATCERIFNLTRHSSLSSRLQKALVTHKCIMKKFVLNLKNK